MQNLLRILFWAALLFALVMASLPHPPEVIGIKSDKVQHILAFLCLATLGSAAFPGKTLRVLVGLFAFGALIEFVQMIPELHRDAEFLDWVADASATSVVLLAVIVWRKLAAAH